MAKLRASSTTRFYDPDDEGRRRDRDPFRQIGVFVVLAVLFWLLYKACGHPPAPPPAPNGISAPRAR